ncbi:hypothetical protein NQZ68_016764 [Dissostichus eleginoides]|nr:hypothetical protein NQZ68_016764 [Dissostichus eleginoides]
MKLDQIRTIKPILMDDSETWILSARLHHRLNGCYTNLFHKRQVSPGVQVSPVVQVSPNVQPIHRLCDLGFIHHPSDTFMLSA